MLFVGLLELAFSPASPSTAVPAGVSQPAQVNQVGSLRPFPYTSEIQVALHNPMKNDICGHYDGVETSDHQDHCHTVAEH
jgi:hypothetical protein